MLAQADIGIWALRDADRLPIARLARRLPPSDRARLDAMRSETRAQAFAAGRFALRCALADVSGAGGWTVEILSDPLGRPHAAGRAISLSHAGGWAIAAVALGPENDALRIGCDVEPPAPRPNLDRLIARVLTSDERAAVEALEPSARLEAFLCYWRRKEACLKAVGGGLSRLLAGFSTVASPARIPGAGHPVHFRDAEVNAACIVAVAQTAPIGRVICAEISTNEAGGPI